MTTSLELAPRTSDVKSRYATFLSRHASLMPTFAAVAILIVLLISAQARFAEVPEPRQHVGSAARQRVPAWSWPSA